LFLSGRRDDAQKSQEGRVTVLGDLPWCYAVLCGGVGVDVGACGNVAMEE
jgi:hypothetical protein